MSQYTDRLKQKWQTQKDAANQGTGIRGQVKTLVGRGDDVDHHPQHRRNDHVATPISSLRDPASFAPPPRRNPNAIAAATSPATPSSPASQTGPTMPPRPGTAQELASDEPPPASKPWRLDTTGLSTAHLPPPPGRRRDGADSRSPPPPPPPAGGGRPGPPSLPPRLPPRSSSTSPALPARRSAPSPVSGPGPGPGQGYLNQSAITRLGAAGISVPGLGITPTSTAPPPPPAARSPSTTTNTNNQQSQLNELQSRFAQLKTKNPAHPSDTAGGGGGGGGTTPDQKASALRTAAAFRSDPSSVSLSDARAAAGTAQNFGQRHGAQVGAAAASLAAAAGKKKPPPPPPPPKKKAGLGSVGGTGHMRQGQGEDEGAPPPVPMATRPTF